MFATLIHVSANLVVRTAFAEALMTVTVVAAGRVVTVCIYRAHLTTIEGTLINVLATLILEDVAGCTCARVAAGLVVARLIGGTACLLRGAFVDIFLGSAGGFFVVGYLSVK